MVNLRHVGIVRAGQMGSGIAQVCVAAGLDVSDAALDRGMAAIAAGLERQMKKGTLSADAKVATLSRIRTATVHRSLEGAGVVIEAATENLELKLRILKQLSETIARQAVIASNTSSPSPRSSGSRQPDWAGPRPGHHADVHRGIRRPQVPPCPAAQGNGVRWTSRPQKQARLLQLRMSDVSEYVAPLKHMQFVLQEIAPLSALASLPAFAEVNVDLAPAILEDASKFANGALSPPNVIGDREGCQCSNDAVSTAGGWRDAYRHFT